MKLQHPEIFPVSVACLCADGEFYHHPKGKTFCLANFLAQKKRRLRGGKRPFFLQESLG
jgi:hypothetical protein